MAGPARSGFRKQGARVLCAGLAMLLSACGMRGPRVPPLAAELADLIVMASFRDEPAPELAGPLLMDSVAFTRLEMLVDESLRPVRQHSMVDPLGVLECPPREPCRMRGDAIFLTVWDARRLPDGQLDLVVSRTQNIRRLYVMTTSVTHELRLRPEGDHWVLVSRVRLPG